MGPRPTRNEPASSPSDVAPGGVIAVQVIGFPAITSNGTPVRLRYKKSEALLYYLAIENRPASRSFLTHLLWPDLDARAGARNLRGVLTDLRAMLGPRLQADSASGSIALLQVRCDRHQLKSPHDPGRSASLLPDDVRPLLDNDPLLEGFDVPDSEGFDAWRQEVNDRFQDERHAIRFATTDLALQNDQTDLAIALLEASLAYEPWNELVAQRLATLHLQWQSPARALSVLDEMTRALQGELGERPDPSTQRLRSIIRAMGTSAPSNLLPLQGRHHEIETLQRALVDPPSQIVTLRAAPGMGSSRVLEAAHTAARLRDPSAITRIDGDAHDTAEAVSVRIDTALQEAARDEETHGAGRLRVILDGFAGNPNLARIVETLTTRPDVSLVMVHAWRPLDLSNERVVEMRGLATPATVANRPSEVLATPSARLLADAYRALRPAPRDGDATQHPAFPDWVRASEGHPATLLTMAQHLHDVGMEASSPHDDGCDAFAAPGANLTAFLAPLEPGCRRVATALSLYRHGTTAETLCRATTFTEAEVAEHLDHLVADGLAYRTGESRDVVRIESGIGPALRYQARDDRDAEDERRREALAWIERLEPLAAPELGSAQRDLTTQALDVLDDVDAAISFLTRDAPRKAVRLATLASSLNRAVRRPDKVIAQLAPLLEAHGEELSPQHRIEGRNALSVAYAFAKQLDSARSLQERAMTEADGLDDAFLRAQTRLNLGYVHVLLGTTDEAIRLFNEAGDIARAGGLTWLLGGSLINLGHALKDEQRHDEAITAYLGGIDAMRRCGDALSEAAGSIGLVSAYASTQDTEALAKTLHALNVKLGRLPRNGARALASSLERNLDTLAHLGLTIAFEHLERIAREHDLIRS